MLSINLIADTDSYKHGHAMLINEGLTFQYSYGEARVKAKYDNTLYIGMNVILKDYFSKQITQADLDEAIEVTTATHGFNPLDVEVWQRVIDECDGYLPIEIKSAPEGSLIPADNVLFTINSTKDWFAKSVQLLEPLLMHIWYTSTIATRCYYIYKHILPYYEESGTVDSARFALHDFGFRGATRRESAIVAGMMQLFVFDGSDNMAASKHLRHYYEGAPLKGKSICATEHSVALSYGRGEGEKKYIQHIMKQMGGKPFSIVLDTYDTYGFIRNVVADKDIKKEIEKYEGRIVFRPDCYSDDTKILTNKGWKLFTDLTSDDLVAQVLDNGTYEFVLPDRIINEYYEGEMVHYYDQKRKLDLLVTPNHRMVYKKNNEILTQEASECNFYHNKNLLRSAKAKLNTKKLTPLEKLKIAFQADGSYVTNSDKKIRFSFSKQRKIDRLVSIINELNYPYNKYELGDNSTEIHISVNVADFSKIFNWVDIENLSGDWCQEFIEELSYWDASRRSDTRFKFDTTVKENIDVIELIAMSAGYGVLLTESEDNRKEQFNNIFTAHIMKNNELGGQAVTKEIIQYKGNVVCVTVPSGRIIVKRNDGQVVSGNSGDPIQTPLNVLTLLNEFFGSTPNDKGYKVINYNIGVIQGDGMDENSVPELFRRVVAMGFSADNIVTGSGGGLHQKDITRDTQRFAIKPSFGVINDEPYNFKKQPSTDLTKTSKSGKLKLHPSRDSFSTISSSEMTKAMFNGYIDVLQTVYKDGVITYSTWDEVINRVDKAKERLLTK